MNESRDVFNSRIEKKHIQREEFEEFLNYVKEGKAFAGRSDRELEKLRNDLENDNVEHSNDMVIEMIIEKVKMDTEGLLNKKLLENIQIGYISNDNSIIASAYPKYSDGSLYIEIGRRIEEKIFLLADLFAVLFLKQEPLNERENDLIYKLHTACVENYIKDCKNTENYDNTQLEIHRYEKSKSNEKFSDNYITYSREIHEMALAFLIGHEIGHHYHGHTNPDLKNQEEPKEKEVKADVFGIDFAMRYLKNSYPNQEERYGLHQFAGIYIPMIASIELSKSFFEEGKFHPSIYQRIRIVNNYLKRIIGSESFDYVKGYICQLVNYIQSENIHLKRLCYVLKYNE